MSTFRHLSALAFADDTIYFGEEDGPVLSMPAYALLTMDGEIAAYGEEASEAGPEVPDNLRRVRLVERGVAVEPALTGTVVARAFKQFSRPFYKRRIVIGAVPPLEPAKAAMRQISMALGATEVFLLEQCMATALGLGLDVQNASPQVVLSLHEDWCEFAVLQLGSTVTQFCLPIGLAEVLADIRIHAKQVRQILLEPAALRAQFLQTGLAPASAADLAGWEAWLGRTELGRVTRDTVSPEVFGVGAVPALLRIAQAIQDRLATLPAGQRYKLTDTALHVCGCGIRPPGVAEALQQMLGWRVRVHREVEHPVLAGVMKVFPKLAFLREVTAPRRKK